jgi:hypothetical protein
MTNRDIPTFGIAKIVTREDGRYRPDIAGEWAAVVPVHDRFGELVDLCAWFPNEPQRWWLRLGEATPILGTKALAIAAAEGEPINLQGTPERWLMDQGGACIRPPGACAIECATCALPRGACILRWDVDLRELFEGVARVDCDCSELRRRLLQSLRGWEPRVTARHQEVRHAA